MGRPIGYPANWAALSHALKVACGWRCESCGVAHGAWGWRRDNREGTLVEVARTGPLLPPFTMLDDDGVPRRVIRIVLTAAHIDRTLEHGSMWDRLRCWCQRCHLRYDIDQHRSNAWATRRAAMATDDLFGQD